MPEITLSALAVSRARTLGDTGERWIESLPAIVADLISRWGLHLEASLAGASTAFVANVTTADGRLAVLKVFVPEGAQGASSFRDEMLVLTAAGGDPYVAVYDLDLDAGAVVMQRLGRSMDTLRLSVVEQLDVIATVLPRGWKPAPEGLVNGADKAASLRRSIGVAWHELGEPCEARTIDVALAHCDARREAHDPASAVLVHGDAHSQNVLEASPEGPTGDFRLIDPEGLASEPAHDLAIILRGCNRELLDGDPRALATQWCHRLADATGVDAQAIWEWSSIERTSTGLLLLQLGADSEGREYLAAADALAATKP